MKINRLPTSFIYPEISPTDYIFGSGQSLGTILRPDGDWRPYLPPAEVQRRNGIESASCFVEALQHCLATIQEQQFSLLDQNNSARFNFILAEGTPFGGDPLKAAQTFRDDGLIPDSYLPFSAEIKSWEEFASFKGGDEQVCRQIGKEWRGEWNVNYDIGIRKKESLTTKYQKLKGILKYCPPPVSVFGWATDNNGLYIKPQDVEDNHLVELVYIDENNCPYIWDTYPPFLKKLAPNYNFDFGMRMTIGRIGQANYRTNWLVDLIKRLLSLLHV